MEETTSILSGLSFDRILQSIESIHDQKTGNDRNILIVKDYSYANVSMKVERIILSYVDYVNRVVWQRILIYTNHYYPEQFKVNDVVDWLNSLGYELELSLVYLIILLENFIRGIICLTLLLKEK